VSGAAGVSGFGAGGKKGGHLGTLLPQSLLKDCAPPRPKKSETICVSRKKLSNLPTTKLPVDPPKVGNN
jgi:hypothetical protein